jgi:hypothetical protein
MKKDEPKDKFELTKESLRKLFDEYLIPAAREEANRLVANHVLVYHREQETPLTLSISGVEIGIRAKK